jgi:hypothetical protein
MFSVAIENSSVRGYFTEKLIDCFAAGAIPIYWGDNDISEHFSVDGMVICKTESDVIRAVKSLADISVAERLYRNSTKAIMENHEKAKQYVVAEDRFAHLL